MKHNFRELKIWKDSMDLVFQTYSMTRELPDTERYGLVTQINRSSISIPSNIAEGTSRNSIKEIIRYLDIALGSSYELETQYLLVINLYPSLKDKTSALIYELGNVQKMIGGIKRKIMSVT